MKKHCYDFAPYVTGYIDDELDSSKQNEIKAHLDDCPDCHQSYLNEKNLKKAVKQQLPVLKAPLYLRRRIRRQIIRNGERPSFWELVQSLFIYRPVTASFALTIIAFLVIFPLHQMMIENSPQLSTDLNHSEYSKEAKLHGEIICLDCEILSRSEGVYTHDPETHRSGLKSEDGVIWSFVHTTSTHELMHNPKYLKRKARVNGTLFSNSRFIFVKNFELL